MRTLRSDKSGRLGYLFVAPATIHLLVFALLPILYAAYVSFFKWDLLKNSKPFVGLDNYLAAYRDPVFWNAMANTAKYALVSVPLGLAVALAVAMLVQQKIRGMAMFRTIYYVPAISSGVAISMLWIYMYLPETGFINTVLKALGGSGQTDFLNDPKWALLALVFMSIWTGLGPRMVLFLAGLLAIPQSLYEAADLDGTTSWQSFRHVTLPMLGPTMMFVVITSTISALQVFTPVYMMTKGGPQNTTDVAGYHIYNEAWSKFHVGLAASKSFVLLLAIAFVAFGQMRLMRERSEGYAGT